MSSTAAKNHGNHSKSLIFSLHTMIREVLKGNRENISRLEKPLPTLAPIEPRIWLLVWNHFAENAVQAQTFALKTVLSDPQDISETKQAHRGPLSDQFQVFQLKPSRAGRFSFHQTTRDNSRAKSYFDKMKHILGLFGTCLELNEVKRSPLDQLRSIEKEIWHASSRRIVKSWF